MKTDFSEKIYEKYFECEDERVTITVKSGENFTGRIIGFSHGDPYGNDFFIRQWHLLSEEEEKKYGIDCLDESVGKKILSKNILSVYFYEDGSSLVFQDC